MSFLTDSLLEQLIQSIATAAWRRPKLPALRELIKATLKGRTFRELTVKAFETFAANSQTALPQFFDADFIAMPAVQKALVAYIVKGEAANVTRLTKLYTKHCLKTANVPDVQKQLSGYLMALRETFTADPTYGPVLSAERYGDDSAVVERAAATTPEVVAALWLVRSGVKVPAATKERWREIWLQRLVDVKELPQARAAIGRALGLLGLDNRPGVGLRPDGLPDLEWVTIPEGEFTYQEKTRLKLPAFRISPYPVTYIQFQAFIYGLDGFYNPRWWDGLDASERHRSTPSGQAHKYPNHPCERVSWYDAVAFCQWLSVKLGYEVTLPNEAQWEKAARGENGLLYPYGNQFDPTKANTAESGIQQTSAVGIFPDGASPYGVLDMSGNVSEWCLNEYSHPENTQLAGWEWRVRRGGSWDDEQFYVHTTYRHDSYVPEIRSKCTGFRVVSGVPTG